MEVHRPRCEAMVTRVVDNPLAEDIPLETAFQGLFTKVQSPPLPGPIRVFPVMLHVSASTQNRHLA